MEGSCFCSHPSFNWIKSNKLDNRIIMAAHEWNWVLTIHMDLFGHCIIKAKSQHSGFSHYHTYLHYAREDKYAFMSIHYYYNCRHFWQPAQVIIIIIIIIYYYPFNDLERQIYPATEINIPRPAILHVGLYRIFASYSLRGRIVG